MAILADFDRCRLFSFRDADGIGHLVAVVQSIGPVLGAGRYRDQYRLLRKQYTEASEGET